MNLPSALFVIRCLIGDTFRQALAARTFWLLLLASGLAILFCLSISLTGPRSLQHPGELELYGPDDKPLTGPNPQPGLMSLGFGLVTVQVSRDTQTEMHFLLVMLAKWVAGAAGMLLVLIWTAAFLPEFLQPSAASVLLAKPISRWSLLVGKYLGVLVFVAFQAAVFVGGTWLALGLRTGIWVPGYLLTIPLLLLHFAMVYSFSALLAVATRSTVACVFGSILFWFVCFGINYARHATVAQPYLAPESPPVSAAARGLVETSYWIMPKPADIMMLHDEALHSKQHFATLPAFETVIRHEAWQPELSILSSFLFTLVLLAFAAVHFASVDY